MDEHPVTVAEFRRFVKATGHVTVAEIAPDAAGVPGRRPRPAGAGLARLHPAGAAGQPRRLPRLVVLDARRAVASSRGPGQHAARPRPASRSRTSRTPTRWRTPRGPARSCRPRPSGSSRPAADSRARPTPGETSSPPRATDDGQHLAGRLPRAERPAGRVRAHVAGRQVPAQRLRPGRHDRQRLGVDVPGLHQSHADQAGAALRSAASWRRRRAVADRNASPTRQPSSSAAPEATSPKVVKGGSHLCAPNYCLRYRPAARQSQTVDTSTSHLGFRCIVRP